MKKRYLLTAEFVDSDFDLGYDGKRYWFKANAISRFNYLEEWRRDLRITNWRFILIDTKTNSVIRPLGETQAAN